VRFQKLFDLAVSFLRVSIAELNSQSFPQVSMRQCSTAWLGTLKHIRTAVHPWIRQQPGRHGPASGGGQDPANGSEPLLITGAAGALNSLDTSAVPQSGQFGFSLPRTSNSNSLPQFSQAYSKIGIVTHHRLEAR
jgi:hypothetical protein